MQLYANNATSRLVAGISNVSLSLQISAGDGLKFPNPTGGDFFLVTLSKVTSGIESAIEIVKVTARATDVFTIIRAQEGTTALVYAESDFVQLRMTAATSTAVEAHLNNTSNPHSVTKTQVGLASVDNTSDADKPVSTAQATALGLKFDKTGGAITGNLTVNNSTDSRTVLQVSGVSQAQFQATASAIRLASNGTIPLVMSTDGVDRITADNLGNITFGAASASGVYTFKGLNTADLVVFESTDASATAAPDVVLYRNSSSPAASDQIGNLVWRGKDSGGADQQYGRIGVTITDPTAASEDSEVWFETTVAGSSTERLRLTATGVVATGVFSATGAVTGSNLSGTNTGDNAVNTLYSGLVTNATHTGDATGSGALTVVRINGVALSGLATGLLKNTTGTGVPTIAVPADITGQLLTGYVSGAGTVAATDTILQAINKLNGNDAAKANIASPTFTGTVGLVGVTETVYNLAGTVIDVANGTIQTKTLSGATTFTESLADGQSVMLGITAGAHAVTWPTTVWAKVGGSGVAPTLTSTGVNWVILWQTGGTLRGSFLGTT